MKKVIRIHHDRDHRFRWYAYIGSAQVAQGPQRGFEDRPAAVAGARRVVGSWLRGWRVSDRTVKPD